MIVDTLENASRYYMIHPAFEMAMDYLDQFEGSDFKAGHLELSGSDIFVNAMDRPTTPEADTIWEAHESYMDIHFLVEGKERIQYAEEGKMSIDVPYDEAKDCTLFKGAQGLEVAVPTGGFAVFFPGEIHRAMMADGEPSGAKKLVVKIRMD